MVAAMIAALLHEKKRRKSGTLSMTDWVIGIGMAAARSSVLVQDAVPKSLSWGALLKDVNKTTP